MTQPRYAVPRDDRRDCALYRIRVLDPRTDYTTVTLGYIGETVRMPFTRFMEHLYDQPWGDTIVGTPEVDRRAFAGKAAVLAAEEAAVRAEKPLYNIEYQKGAPHQIPQWTAREQRASRDAAAGRATPDWAAKGSATTSQPAAPLTVWTSKVWPVVLAVLAHQLVWWAFGATVLFAALWRLLADQPHAVVWSALVTAATVAAVVWKSRPARRRRRRRRT